MKNAQKVETADSEPWLPHLRSTPAITEPVTMFPPRLTSDKSLYTDFFCYVWECQPTNQRSHLLTLFPFSTQSKPSFFFAFFPSAPLSALLKTKILHESLRTAARIQTAFQPFALYSICEQRIKFVSPCYYYLILQLVCKALWAVYFRRGGTQNKHLLMWQG